MTSAFTTAARSFGARVRMTRADHLSGTDRVAEVASAENAEIIVNIQGDEPLIDPGRHRRRDPAAWSHEPDIPMGTLKKRIEDPREITDPNVVKVVTDRAGNAIYFSRSPIPYRRDRSADTPYFKHIGLYVYRRDFLLAYSDAAGGSARTGRAAGAVARARKRVPDPRGGNRVRVAGRGYAGGSGAGVQIVRSFNLTGNERMAKYIFVTGGVVSSLGKGHRGRVASAACSKAAD